MHEYDSNLFVLDSNGKATRKIEKASEWVFEYPSVAYRIWEGEDFELKVSTFLKRDIWYKDGVKINVKDHPNLEAALKTPVYNSVFGFGVWPGNWKVVNYTGKYRLVHNDLESVSSSSIELQYIAPSEAFDLVKNVLSNLPIEGLVLRNAVGNVDRKVYIYRNWFDNDEEQNVLF